MNSKSLLYGRRRKNKLAWPHNHIGQRSEKTIINIWIQESDKEVALKALHKQPEIASATVTDLLPELYGLALVATQPGAPQIPPSAEKLFDIARKTLTTAGINYCRPPAHIATTKPLKA